MFFYVRIMCIFVKTKTSNMDSESKIGCLIQSVILIIYGYVSYACMDYITNYFGKDLHWILDLLLGMVSLTVSIWAALILWLIS